MADIDPFSGGSSFSKPQEKQKKALDPNTIQLIKKIIIAIIIIGALGIIVYFLFFNTQEISFNVKDREGNRINTSINIQKVNSTKNYRINSNETIKLNKSKKYTYSVSVNEYNPIRSIPITFDSSEINVVLKKNIRLNIISFTCPSTIFLGQKVRCEIQLENVSSDKDYNTDNLLFEGDVSAWPSFIEKTYAFVDNFGEELSGIRKTIGPLKSGAVFVEFNVPIDKKYLGNKKIITRVAYADNNKQVNFTIQETPDIEFSSDISSLKNIVSGEEVTRKYTINNKKNRAPFSDHRVFIDAGYKATDSDNTDLDINQTFIISLVDVDASSSRDGQITIRIPPTLRKGKIDGNICLDSPMFAKAKCVNFGIDVTEPPNLFEISLSKTSETLTYDTTVQSSNTKTINLNLYNKNKVPVHINSIYIENTTTTSDCNSWIVVPTNYNDYNIQPNENPAPTIILQGKNIVGTDINGVKLCVFNIDYVHPFFQEDIIVKKELQITVN